jgi:predicted PurR-regulated permease PerM
MPFIDTKRQRAALLISALGLGLVYALWPFITGLMGALVLYVVFSPLYRALIRRGARPGVTAGIVVLVALLLVVGPGISFIGLLANQAQDMAQGVLSSPLLARLRELRLGPYDIGAQIEQLGSQIVSWAGSSAISVVGTAPGSASSSRSRSSGCSTCWSPRPACGPASGRSFPSRPRTRSCSGPGSGT